MNTSLHRQQAHALVPWLVVIALGLLLAWVYNRGNQVSVSHYLLMESHAKDALALDTRINLDALRLRQRQLQNYDSLTQASRDLGVALSHLEPGYQSPELRKAYGELLATWESKLGEIEYFKRYNALFVNAHEHFINLASTLPPALARSDLPQDQGNLARLSQDMLIFVNARVTQNPQYLLQRCRLVGKLAPGVESRWRTHLQALGRHCEALVEYHPLTQHKLDLLIGHGFNETLLRAHELLEADYRTHAKEAEVYHQLSTLLGITLLGVLGLILGRLRRASEALKQSHALLDNIADNLGEGIVAFNPAGELQFLNRQAELILKLDPGEGLKHKARDILREDEPRQGKHSLCQAMEDKTHFQGECWLRRSDGTRFPAALLGGPLPLDDAEVGYVASLRDVTALRNAEARVVLAGQVFENLAEAMTITGPDGRIQSVNPAFSEITGFSEAEALGHTPGELLASGRHDETFYQEMWRTLSNSGKWQGEIINRRKDGSTYPEWLSIAAVYDTQGEVSHYIGLFSDITKRKEAEAHIHHLAYHDALTGLPNRLLFNDRLSHAITQAQRSQRMLAVMMLDLDRFKSVNDSLGHNVGDQLLVEIATRLSGTLRAGDTLARLGGDEFALLMPEVKSHADAATLASKMVKQFERSVSLDGHEFFASTSIGIALYPGDGSSGSSLLRSADQALYTAKDAGRSVFRFFVPHKAQDTVTALEMESALRQALARNQISLHYQLQVDARSNKATGVEALMRWNHPEYGQVPPDRFIPLAESLGIIDQLGTWALRAACRQLMNWWGSGVDIPRMAVNVSAMQLRQAGFVDQVMEIIQQEGMPPHALELELTETMLSTDIQGGFDAFAHLRKQGIKVAIDDFGTGYSSLSYLCNYPVDVVKIDRSFVRGLETDADQEYVVRAIILLAQSLGMRTIAEGVETEGQRNRLFVLGCDELQGYLLARPGSAEVVTERMAHWAERPL